MSNSKRFLAILSEKGGGDRPPVIALACGLRDKGHSVAVLCDQPTKNLISSTRLTAYVFPPELDHRGQIRNWFKKLKQAEESVTADAPNPMVEWAEPLMGAALNAVEDYRPDGLISSLFGLGLADLVSERIGTPWCFVNPSFFFGEEASRTWEEDWHGPYIPRLARDCFLPLASRATLVLHATDPEFDFAPKLLPDHHHFVGFLQWEPDYQLPEFLLATGDPWALITLSSVRQEDEATLAMSALSALSHRRVRALLTQPDREIEEGLDSVPSNATIAGFVPHSPVLEQSSIVINHAGHGIVSKALGLGVPMVLLPWDRDQPGVAARAEKLGVAYVVPRNSADSAEVTIGVNSVLDNPAYREASEYHARRLSKIDSLGLATRLISQM